MTKESVLASLAARLGRKWQALMETLQRRNDAAVAAWGTSLLYRRRFTNPEDAKRHRKN
ncbi:MAG: hypothetical protein ACXWUS_14725 [Burkholderiales bacterium]